jgi:hypothetical protein
VAGVRYLDVIAGRMFYEIARPDGAHELRTEALSTEGREA